MYFFALYTQKKKFFHRGDHVGVAVVAGRRRSVSNTGTADTWGLALTAALDSCGLAAKPLCQDIGGGLPGVRGRNSMEAHGTFPRSGINTQELHINSALHSSSTFEMTATCPPNKPATGSSQSPMQPSHLGCPPEWPISVVNWNPELEASSTGKSSLSSAKSQHFQLSRRSLASKRTASHLAALQPTNMSGKKRPGSLALNSNSETNPFNATTPPTGTQFELQRLRDNWSPCRRMSSSVTTMPSSASKRTTPKPAHAQALCATSTGVSPVLASLTGLGKKLVKTHSSKTPRQNGGTDTVEKIVF